MEDSRAMPRRRPWQDGGNISLIMTDMMGRASVRRAFIAPKTVPVRNELRGSFQLQGITGLQHHLRRGF